MTRRESYIGVNHWVHPTSACLSGCRFTLIRVYNLRNLKKNCLLSLLPLLFISMRNKTPPNTLTLTYLPRVNNRWPMSHFVHLRKQVKSMNTYGYIITLIKRRKNPSLSIWELNGSSFEQTWIFFTQGCFVSSFVEIGTVVLEKIFEFHQCIFAIS